MNLTQEVLKKVIYGDEQRWDAKVYFGKEALPLIASQLSSGNILLIPEDMQDNHIYLIGKIGSYYCKKTNIWYVYLKVTNDNRRLYLQVLQKKFARPVDGSVI